jgi:hypothetical protein
VFYRELAMGTQYHAAGRHECDDLEILDFDDLTFRALRFLCL